MKLIILLMALMPVVAGAEDFHGLQPVSGLTLSDVVTRTMDRNPQQHVLQAQQSLVEARGLHASGMLPAAPAVTMRHQSDMIGSGRNLREWEASLELPIWMPGQRGAREALAREAKDGLNASRGSMLLAVAGQVRDAVWDVAMGINGVELAEDRLKTAQALQQDVEKRWKAGELAKTDVMLAQNEVLQAQTALLRAQTELKHAEHRYWMLTGIKEIPALPQESLTEKTGLDQTHPMLAEIDARIALAHGERDLVRIEKRENPQLMLFARHERGAFDSAFDSSVGLAVRVPLDAEVRSAPLLAEAEVGLARVMSERDQLRRTLESALHEAEHNLETTRAELKIAETQNQLAQGNLRLARKAFALGESDLVSLLRVQALAQEAERYLRDRQTQLQWNIARYNQAVGVLP